MKFSEYVVIDPAGQSADPLGFRRPGGALQDMLFPQFTVLTLHPAYLGALCCIVQQIQTLDLKGAGEFAMQFRVREIIWGLANVSVGQSLINITKYETLKSDTISLASIRKGHAVFRRLAYGTLGHYSRAAISWGLLDASGRKLTAAGAELASAFARRHEGKNLSGLMKAWIAGDTFSAVELQKAGEIYGLHAANSTTEQCAWRETMKSWSDRHPNTAPLWNSPLTYEAIEKGLQSATTYDSFWSHVGDTYPALSRELLAITRFERLAGAVQFVFELKLAMLEYRGTFENVLPNGVDAFAARVVELAQAYVSSPCFRDAKRLFASVAATPPDFRSLTATVIEHHVAHHGLKGTSPFLNRDAILVSGRVNPESVRSAMVAFEERSGDGHAQLQDLQYRYRRQWHFEKCRRWSDYAAGRLETAA